MDPLWYLVSFIYGAMLAVLVTDKLSRGSGFWSHRIADTPFRWANAPVGAYLAGVVSWFLGYPEVWLVLSAAAGMFIAALAWAWVYPAHD